MAVGSEDRGNMAWLVLPSLLAAGTTLAWPSSCVDDESMHTRCTCAAAGRFHVPPDVVSIPANALAECHGVTSVSGMAGVVSVGQGAFRGLTGLTSFAWPSGAKAIPAYAFFHCDSLSELTGLHDVSSIGPAAFMFDKSLPHVYLPPECTAIGENAFMNTKGYKADLRLLPRGHHEGLTKEHHQTRGYSVGPNAFYGSHDAAADEKQEL